jgi:hypothetical protein
VPLLLLLLLPQVDFWVWDSGIPMLNASAVRTVVLDKPCPTASAPFFCEDPATGRSFCSGEVTHSAPFEVTVCAVTMYQTVSWW